VRATIMIMRTLAVKTRFICRPREVRCAMRLLPCAITGVLLTSAPALSQHRLFDPDNPSTFMPRLNEEFQAFHRSHHYFPEDWFDLWAICRINIGQDQVAMCREEKMRPERERRSYRHDNSRYTYYIDSRSDDRYRITAIDSDGIKKFYVDEKGIVQRIR
jgi:hypothetical protein